MTTVLLVNPTTLVGKEVREELERHPELWSDLRLISRDDEEIGTLTEIAGAAAMVGRGEDADLAAAGLVFFCGSREATLELLPEVGASAVTVILASDATVDDGLPLVAGVNLDVLDGDPAGRPLLSPHPATILLAHLLHPLRPFGIESAVATLIQPASVYGEAGLDELYGQARRVIAIAGQQPAEVLPGQLAFNLFPSHLPGAHLAAEVAAVLGEGGVEPAVEIIQGAVFHSYAAALHVRLRERPEPDEVRQALADHPQNRLAEEPELLGPVDAAASAEVIVGPVRGAAGGGIWIWGVMDNLTRGGALNALEIAERALGRS